MQVAMVRDFKENNRCGWQKMCLSENKINFFTDYAFLNYVGAFDSQNFFYQTWPNPCCA
jgi:hypothetical protein